MKILSKINVKKHVVKFIFNVSLIFTKNFQIILTNNNNFISIFKVKMFKYWYMYVHLKLYNLYNEV